MAPPIRLISMEDYLGILHMESYYSGYVFDPLGLLFEVHTEQRMVKSDYPFPSSYDRRGAHSHGTKFVDLRETIHFSHLSLEGKDFVFNENGDYAGNKPQSNDDRPGQIYIRRYKGAQPGWKQPPKSAIDFEDTPIQDFNAKLPPEVYSRIFTYIVSLMMNRELDMIRNRTVSVHRAPRGTHSLNGNTYNMQPRERAKNDRTNAAYFGHFRAMVAYLRPNDSSNQEMYSTLWNVLNLLGAHELAGHGVSGWMDDDHDAHYLDYAYQMGHPTYRHTTKRFKETIKEEFNNNYEKSRFEHRKDWHNDRHRTLQSHDLFRSRYESERDSIRHTDWLQKHLQDPNQVKRVGDQIKPYGEPIDKRKK